MELVDKAFDHDDLDDVDHDLDIDDLVTPPLPQRAKLQVKFAKDGEQAILDFVKQGKKRHS